MSFFGSNNKYGRPIPYVWFLIFAVSMIPFILFTNLAESLDCKTIGDNTNQVNYTKSHGFTIEQGKAKCNQIVDQTNTIIKPIASIGMFALLTWRLKPYPLSNPKDESK